MCVGLQGAKAKIRQPVASGDPGTLPPPDPLPCYTINPPDPIHNVHRLKALPVNHRFFISQPPQNRPKRAKTAPRCPKERPRAAKSTPREAQDRPKTAQDRTKTAPRPPKTDQDRPRRPKTAPRPPQDVPRPPQDRKNASKINPPSVDGIQARPVPSPQTPHPVCDASAKLPALKSASRHPPASDLRRSRAPPSPRPPPLIYII